MKNNNFNQPSLFGSYYEYLVLLSPPDLVKNEVKKIKKDLNSIADISTHNLNSIAHITLFNTITYDADFPSVINEFTKEISPFAISVQDWDVYKNGKNFTVYLKIENPNPIVQIMGSVKSKLKSPHMTLAKVISPETYEKLKPYLKNFKYSSDWVCSDITILRRLWSERNLPFRESFKIPLIGLN